MLENIRTRLADVCRKIAHDPDLKRVSGGWVRSRPSGAQILSEARSRDRKKLASLFLKEIGLYIGK
jgi:hypothetical protein